MRFLCVRYVYTFWRSSFPGRLGATGGSGERGGEGAKGEREETEGA